MIYYTSDLHLGNNNIIGYENRPYKTVEEMDADIIYKWNAKVGRNDDVYVLGDFCFKRATRAIEYLKQLNGNIHLLRGNHDYFMSQLSFKHWLLLGDKRFDISSEGHYAHIEDGTHEVVLCHYPILYWDNMERGSIHLYGHVHTYRDCSKMAPDSYNVGVDANNYYPVTLNELLERRGK